LIFPGEEDPLINSGADFVSPTGAHGLPPLSPQGNGQVAVDIGGGGKTGSMVMKSGSVMSLFEDYNTEASNWQSSN
jgi:hypothetical protein